MKMFTNFNDAHVWLYTQGWRQDDEGVWMKGKKIAEVHQSPANDGVVCVVIRNRH